jgi:hypothetical protein
VNLWCGRRPMEDPPGRSLRQARCSHPRRPVDESFARQWPDDVDGVRRDKRVVDRVTAFSRPPVVASTSCNPRAGWNSAVGHPGQGAQRRSKMV